MVEYPFTVVVSYEKKTRHKACAEPAARRRNTPQIWMVLRRARPPRREANHNGMLRSGVPRGGVTYPKCGWFYTGPGLLGERPITKARCDQECRAEA